MHSACLFWHERYRRTIVLSKSAAIPSADRGRWDIVFCVSYRRFSLKILQKYSIVLIKKTLVKARRNVASRHSACDVVYKNLAESAVQIGQRSLAPRCLICMQQEKGT